MSVEIIEALGRWVIVPLCAVIFLWMWRDL